MTGYIIPEGIVISWSDFLPQNPTYLNKLVLKLTDKEEFDRNEFFYSLNEEMKYSSLSKEYGEAIQAIHDLFSISIAEKKKFFSEYKSSDSHDPPKYFIRKSNEKFNLQELRYTSIFMANNDVRLLNKEIVRREIEWVFVLEQENNCSVVERLLAKVYHLLEDDDVIYLLSLLQESDAPNGVAAIYNFFYGGKCSEYCYHHFMSTEKSIEDKQVCWDIGHMIDRLYIKEIMDCLALTQNLRELNKLHKREAKFWDDSKKFRKRDLYAGNLLLKNFVIKDIDSKYLEIFFDEIREIKRWKRDRAEIRSLLYMNGLAIHLLLRNANVKKYFNRQVKTFFYTYQNLLNENCMENIIACIESYLMIHDFLSKEQKIKLMTIIINEVELFTRMNPNGLKKKTSFTQNNTFIALGFLWKQINYNNDNDGYITLRYKDENCLYNNIDALLYDISSHRRTNGDVRFSTQRVLDHIGSISQQTIYHIYLVVKECYASRATEFMQSYLMETEQPYDIANFIKIVEGTTLPEEYVEKSLDKFLQYFSKDSYSHVFKANEFEVL